jgi:cytochrome bd-type quinol oxidase subunit 1
LTLGIWSLILFDRAGRSVDPSAFVPTLHVVFGVFCLAASLVLAMRLFRYVRIPEAGAAAVAAAGGARPQPTGAAI